MTNPTNTNKHSSFKHVMFGDSITEHGAWNELFNSITVINKGISGDTTKDLLRRFDSNIDESTDVVLLMVGINDLIQKRTVDETFHNYKTIIEKLQALDINPIIQSTLFVGEEFHNLDPTINYNVSQLNINLKNYCHSNKLIYLDINKILAPNEILQDQYTYDSVHINKKAYIRWAEYINSKIFEQIK